jgi:hypothetical protein
LTGPIFGLSDLGGVSELGDNGMSETIQTLKDHQTKILPRERSSSISGSFSAAMEYSWLTEYRFVFRFVRRLGSPEGEVGSAKEDMMVTPVNTD